MIAHPGREVLLAHVDGELPDGEERDVSAHASGCAVCRAAVSELSTGVALFASALRVVDGGEPAAWSFPAHDVGSGGHSAGSAVVARPLRHAGARVSQEGLRGQGALRWAAGIVLVSVAGASAAIIGLRMQAQPDERTEPASTSAQAEPGVAALVVTPRAGTLHVAFTGAAAGSRVYVTVEDGASGRVAVAGAESPRFTTVAGRVDVDLRGEPATVRVTLPATLREAIVTAAGVTLVTVRQDSVSPATASTAGILLDAASRSRME